MKKIALFSLIAVIAGVSAANAGWRDMLGNAPTDAKWHEMMGEAPSNGAWRARLGEANEFVPANPAPVANTEDAGGFAPAAEPVVEEPVVEEAEVIEE